MKEPSVLFCDNHLLVLSKPSCMLTQSTEECKTSLEEWGKNWIKNAFQKPGNVFLHAIHRLDKPASGIVLFARTSKALSRLHSLVREEKMQKVYFAIVEGTLPDEQGEFVDWIIHGDHQAQMSFEGQEHAKKSILKYRVVYPNTLKNWNFGCAKSPRLIDRKRPHISNIGSFTIDPSREFLRQPKSNFSECLGINRQKSYTLVQVLLKTGRYHQIRLQFSNRGFPIIGDQKYGSQETLKTPNAIALHHAYLQIPYPVSNGKENVLSWKCAPPSEWPLTISSNIAFGSESSSF